MQVTFGELVVPVIIDKMLDITRPDEVAVLIREDGKVVWINVNGQCMFRACRIGKLTLVDHRVQS